MYNTQPISGSKTVPSNWKEAQISAIFKKGKKYQAGN
jgi:hypothetical protein